MDDSASSTTTTATSSTDAKHVVFQQRNCSATNLWIFATAIFFRILSAQFLADFFEQIPLFSTPWSSMKRFREGVHLYESGHNIYEGDLVHVMPMFIFAANTLHILVHPIWLRVVWMFLDLLTGAILSEFVREYIHARCIRLSDPQVQFVNAQWLIPFASVVYLLNPMTIGCWTVSSLSTPVNALIAISLYFCLKGSMPLSVLPLAFIVQLNPYYAVLIAPLIVHFKEQKFSTLFLFIFLNAIMYGINFICVGNPHDLFRNTLGFFLAVPDLTPNSGIFWYFFTQVFEHYRLLFLWTFQLNSLIYVVPLTALIRKNPALLSTVLLIMVSLFSAYPSYAETAIYLPTMAAYFDLHKYLRQRLVTGCTVLATFVLSPVMWSMWVITGSGNANFFFAIVWVFNLAQIFISADLMSSYLRAELVNDNGGEKQVEEQFDGVRLYSISPIYFAMQQENEEDSFKNEGSL